MKKESLIPFAMHLSHPKSMSVVEADEKTLCH